MIPVVIGVLRTVLWGLRKEAGRIKNRCKKQDRRKYIIVFACWPPTRPSCEKKKCTSVNNRCIRWKISGDQRRPWLSRGWIECEIVTLAGSRWVSNYYITPATGSSDQLKWKKMLEWEACPNRVWAPEPPVEQPMRTGKKGCDSQKSGGVNMLQFCSVSNSPLTQ